MIHSLPSDTAHMLTVQSLCMWQFYSKGQINLTGLETKMAIVKCIVKIIIGENYFVNDVNS